MTEDPKHNRQKLRSTVKMVAALRAGNVSRDHLIAISGLSRDYVHAFVTLMRGAGQIYRSGYGENARRARNVELFTLGSESDVPTITGRKRGKPGRVLKTAWIDFDPPAALKSKKASRRKPLVAIPQAVREVAPAE